MAEVLTLEDILKMAGSDDISEEKTASGSGEDILSKLGGIITEGRVLGGVDAAKGNQDVEKLALELLGRIEASEKQASVNGGKPISSIVNILLGGG